MVGRNLGNFESFSPAPTPAKLARRRGCQSSCRFAPIANMGIGHVRITFSLSFKSSLGAHPFI